MTISCCRWIKKRYNLWNSRSCNLLWIIFCKIPSKMRPTCNLETFLTQILKILLRKSKKNVHPTLRKQDFRWNPLALATHAHVAWLCAHADMHACTYVHRVVRARVSRVWADLPKVFGQISPKFVFWRRNLAKIEKVVIFIFGAARRASPKGWKKDAESALCTLRKMCAGECASKNFHMHAHARARFGCMHRLHTCSRTCAMRRVRSLAKKHAPEA